MDTTIERITEYRNAVLDALKKSNNYYGSKKINVKVNDKTIKYYRRGLILITIKTDN